LVKVSNYRIIFSKEVAMSSANYFRFNLANYECLVVRDGKCPVPNQPMISVTCLLVKTPEQVVLVDTGCGNVFGAHAGQLIQNLQSAGINSTDINTVFISHAHSDHIGGNTDEANFPSFPHAQYYIGKREWEFWTGTPDLTCQPESIRQNLLHTIKKNLIPIAKRIVKVPGEKEVTPGFSFIKAPGHTPGNVALKITSGVENLICVGDVFHHPEEIEKLDLYTAPLMAKEGRTTRVKLLSQAVKLDALVFACHFPFPGLGHILQKDESFSWQSLGIQ
jgi:glyoxylase-like metal-dependent hydrolase (beta-lactamase superfamily II)